MDSLHESRLSKYNNSSLERLSALGLQSTDRRERLLVIDQTVGDAAVAGAGANSESFEIMLKNSCSQKIPMPKFSSEYTPRRCSAEKQGISARTA